MDSVQGPATGAIAVEFKLTREDLVPVLRWQLSSNVQIRIAFAVGAVFVLCGAIILAVPKGSANAGGTLVGIGVLYVALYGWVVRRTPVRVAKKTIAATQGPTKLEFADDAVHVHTAMSDLVNRWGLYTETLQRGDMYLLRIGKRRAYTFVPKRAFRSRSDELAFREPVTRQTSAQLQNAQ